MYKIFSNYKRHLPKSYIMGTLIRRREDPEYATGVPTGVGTRGSVRDNTVDASCTTMGAIPDGMFELDTSYDEAAMTTKCQEAMTEGPKKEVTGVSGFAAHSTLFSILLIALLALLLICCISACFIARARKKHASSDMECDPDCEGRLTQPLINGNRMSESSSKSSISSRRN